MGDGGVSELLNVAEDVELPWVGNSPGGAGGRWARLYSQL
jgi:hypothetical protein